MQVTSKLNWSEGHILFVRNGADISHVCIKCGAAPSFKAERVFSYVPLLVVVGVLFLSMLYSLALIVPAVMFTALLLFLIIYCKKVKITFALCAEHRPLSVTGVVRPF